MRTLIHLIINRITQHNPLSLSLRSSQGIVVLDLDHSPPSRSFNYNRFSFTSSCLTPFSLFSHRIFLSFYKNRTRNQQGEHRGRREWRTPPTRCEDMKRRHSVHHQQDQVKISVSFQATIRFALFISYYTASSYLRHSPQHMTSSSLCPLDVQHDHNLLATQSYKQYGGANQSSQREIGTRDDHTHDQQIFQQLELLAR